MQLGFAGLVQAVPVAERGRERKIILGLRQRALLSQSQLLLSPMAKWQQPQLRQRASSGGLQPGMLSGVPVLFRHLKMLTYHHSPLSPPPATAAVAKLQPLAAARGA